MMSSLMDITAKFHAERELKIDRIIFDCFQQYLGCKTADDVFTIMTSPGMFHHYNDILPYINEKLAQEIGSFGSSGLPHGVFCCKCEEMTEPAKGSREMLGSLRTRWEEVYNEN